MLKPDLQDELDDRLLELLGAIRGETTHGKLSTEARQILDDYTHGPEQTRFGEKLLCENWEADWRGEGAEAQTLRAYLFGDATRPPGDPLVESLQMVFGELIRFVLDTTTLRQQKQNKTKLEERLCDYLDRRGCDILQEHELTQWVADKLKGIQRRVMELTIQGGGKCRLPDLAIDEKIQWGAPYDNAFNGICREVNKKMKQAGLGWKLARRKNKSRLEKIGQK